MRIEGDITVAVVACPISWRDHYHSRPLDGVHVDGDLVYIEHYKYTPLSSAAYDLRDKWYHVASISKRSRTAVSVGKFWSTNN
jgi:hypothetical protein